MGKYLDIKGRLTPKLDRNSAVVARAFGYTLVHDPQGSAEVGGSNYFTGHLRADHYNHNGDFQGSYNLGSGKVNEAFVVALAKDWQGTTNNKAAPVITTLNRMYSGTGTNGEQAYDYSLQTPVVGGATTAAITPTFAIAAASNNSTVQWQGTITYSGSSAITEWGLFNLANVAQAPVSFYHTSTDTFSATTVTPGASPGWVTNALAGWVVVVGGSSGTANQTGQSEAFIESNSNTALTIAQASNDGISYWTTSNNGGSAGTPSTNTSMDVWPFMEDHKTFGAINVVNGDSITFTYTLTIQSGG